jgi:galactokinase
MSKPGKRIRATTPGRICLFGEHQDYLGLPVIPCAISLRITIGGIATRERVIDIDLPDIHSREFFPLDGFAVTRGSREYFRSAVVVMRRRGFTFSHGFRGTLHGTIPINAGTSSSSAIVVSWINVLARISDQAQPLDPEHCARYAHEAEVMEFGEPGGMMDHFSTALGGVLAIDFTPRTLTERLTPTLGTFVLGNSGQPKDTRGVLSRVKNGVQDIVRKMQEIDSGSSLMDARSVLLDRFAAYLSDDEKRMLGATTRIHEITQEARELLRQPAPDASHVGRLLTEHQEYLRDVLRISTPKIDGMIDAALEAGAKGAKINGSGGGGCMFAYAPESTEEVAEAIRRAGGDPYIVTADSGTKLES